MRQFTLTKKFSFAGQSSDQTWRHSLYEVPNLTMVFTTCAEFQAFAKEFGRLTFTEAHAMWYKQGKLDARMKR